jgi:hypothetical protein
MSTMKEFYEGDYSRGFDDGQEHTFNLVLEYLKEVPSAEGLEKLIKKIKQRKQEEREVA